MVYQGQGIASLCSNSTRQLRFKMASSRENIFAFPKLDGSNYADWKVDVKMALAAKGLDKFIDLTITPPTDATLLAEFNEKKSKTLGFLYLTLSREIKRLLSSATDPAKAWDILKKTYEPTSRARIAMLRHAFITCKPTNDERIECFLNRVREAAAALAEAGTTVPDSEISYQMIGSLPPEYNGVVLNIYQWSDADFTSEKVKDAITTEADRLRVKNIVHESSSEVMNTQQKKGYDYKSNVYKKKDTRKCYNCGRLGHIAPQCRKPKKNVQGYMQRRDSTNNTTKVFDVATISITDDFKGHENEWIWDSGAGAHLCNNKKWLKNFKTISPIEMRSYSETFTVTGIGDAAIEHQIGNESRVLVLRNVGFAPKGNGNSLLILRHIFLTFIYLTY